MVDYLHDYRNTFAHICCDMGKFMMEDFANFRILALFVSSTFNQNHSWLMLLMYKHSDKTMHEKIWTVDQKEGCLHYI